MMMKDLWCCFRSGGIYWMAGGLLLPILAKKTGASQKAREMAVKGLAGGMKMQQDAAYCLETLKEEAQDQMISSMTAEAENKEAE